MRKFFSVAMGSVVALAGFAGTANASATIDLIWIDVSAGTACMKPANRNCPRLGTTLSNVATSDNITLLVLMTAGPGGSIGAGVSVDYAETAASYTVNGFKSFLTKQPKQWLTFFASSTTNQPTFIDNIGAVAAPTIGLGLGLPAGQSAYLGTVTFHKDVLVGGTFEIKVGIFGPGNTDQVLDGAGNPIASTTTFNSAFLVNVPEPDALSQLVVGAGGILLARRARRS
jgi:hypothetical protein